MPLHDVKDGVWPIPVAVRSEAWVCCCSHSGTVGSNPVAGTDRSLSFESAVRYLVDVPASGC